MLPYIEEDNRYKQIPLPQTGYQVSRQRIGMYLCPSDSSVIDGVADAGSNSYASNYAVNYLVFGDVQNGRLEGAAKIPISFPDGLSNTVMFAEHYAKCTGAGGGAGSIWGNTNPWWRAAFCLPRIGGEYTNDRYRFPPEERGYDCENCRCRPPQAVKYNEGCDIRRAQLLHSGNAMNVGMADGSVRIVTTSVSTVTWAAVCDPRDGVVLGPDW
jgi:prepilin-type processing-associated H-X9-DG protein